MIKKEMLKNNKIIAKFMEMVLVDGLWEARTDDAVFLFNELYEGYCDKDHLIFHLSWAWLMPVVEKIERLGYYTDISGCASSIYHYCWIRTCEDEKYLFPSIGHNGKENESKIQVVFLAVVKFIKWYNKK